MRVLKFISYGAIVIRMATRMGWLAGARYTNLRCVRSVDRLGFLDIDWKNYSFQRHLDAVKATRPMVTVARDILRRNQLDRTLDEADELRRWCDAVIIVPKAKALSENGFPTIPTRFLLGYSVPTSYGGTTLKPAKFSRPTHLLGGRPDDQRLLAGVMPVVSLDCNRFAVDARYGRYFDGARFRHNPRWGYLRCIAESLAGVSQLWDRYQAPAFAPLNRELDSVA